MTLNTLTLKGMDRYGAVDIQRDANKNTMRGFLTAVSLLVVLFLLNMGIQALTKEDEKKIPRVRIKSLADLAPPPSTQDDQTQPLAMAAPAPLDVARPTFGIPVPVPDAVAPQAVMPDMNSLPVNQAVEGVGSGGVDASGVGTSTTPVEIKAKEPEPELSRDEFVSVEQEPTPVQNIQSLVEYPETAKRAGLEGKVTVSALIDKDGRVLKVEVDKSDYPIFEEAAKKALMKARFTPARQNGEPVKLWYTVPIVFKLSGN